MMNPKRIAAVVAALAVVAAGATAAVAAGPTTPLVTSNGGQITCPAFGAAPVTDDDGTVCSHGEVPGLYLIAHGVTAPKTANITLQAPYRGFEAYRLSATQLAVSVGYPTDSKRLYAGALALAWSVSG